MHATEDRVVAVDGVESVVGTPEVEQWKIAVLHCDHTSAPGAWVRTTWVHVEPEQTDRLADLYRMVLLQQIQTRAEADGAAADRRAGEDRATLERVRAELQQLRTDHHDELAQLRREAAE